MPFTSFTLGLPTLASSFETSGKETRRVMFSLGWAEGSGLTPLLPKSWALAARGRIRAERKVGTRISWRRWGFNCGSVS